ncbi:MAG: hypothetical protein ABI847_13455 [Anaerolineales bacterium]
MSGIEHLQDLNYGPRPLETEAMVARAWGLAGFAHHASVGRTLTAVRGGPAPTLQFWFARHNARQTIEAGNKPTACGLPPAAQNCI